MSGRSCSDGRTVFFNAEAEVLDGAPDRRHADGHGQRIPQLGQRAIRLLLDQRRQRVEMWLEFAPRPIPLRARGNLAGLTAPLPQQAYPRAADGVLLGDGIRHHSGVKIAERTNPKIHRVGAHGPPEWWPQEYHDSPTQYKGFLKTALQPPDRRGVRALDSAVRGVSQEGSSRDAWSRCDLEVSHVAGG